ncbi:hypothetical protein ACJ41O_001316 [Fusarium nematophilum]
MAVGNKTDHVDILIVGAGPAGLMMATWMAKCGIKTRIVDKRGTKIFNGQADGLQCRTLEIFDSFGFAHRAWLESNHMLEISLWNPDDKGILRRSSRIPDTIPGISRFQQVVLHQGRIERFFLDSIDNFSNGQISVERGVLPTRLEIDASLAEDPEAYPITVNLRHLSEEEARPKQTATSVNGTVVQDGLFRSNLSPDDTADMLKAAELDSKADTVETVKAKYMLGADGAHSWVRKELGFKLEGESTDYIWGVLDIVPITDFPDIRMRCAIHSASSGSVMVIPRENKLVRLYIQLTRTEKIGDQDSRTDRSWITPEVILESAQKIMAPYKLDYRTLDWWTAYQIGQRVGSSFSAHERVFLAGDAVHTHSPKAGQGMNVSMQDSFNLGWKVANVVKGLANRSILKTYESERKGIAKALIDFDHKFSRLFSGRPAKDIMDEEGISMDAFKEAFEKGNMFASGIAVDYEKSNIVSKPASTSDASLQALASEVKLGMRMPSVKVLNQSDARPWHLQELLRSNGTWRVILFPGNISHDRQKSRMNSLCDKLSSPSSFLKRFTPPSARYDSVIEVLTVHASKRHDHDIFDFPEVLRPYHEVDGWDYNKIFVDDQSYHEGHGKLYETFGISPEGCVVIVRPDQYVSYVGELDDYEALDGFFSGFLIPQGANDSQIEHYLAHIGFPAANHPSDPLELLTELQRRQLERVPFENLSLHYSKTRELSLDQGDLFHKIVSLGKGGYCLENNNLFGQILRTLGFDCIYSAARVKQPSSDGQETGWFGCLPQHKDPSQRVWVYSQRENDELPWTEAYCFTETECLVTDFDTMNYVPMKSPTSFFTQNVIAQRFLMDEDKKELIGSVSLFRDRIKVNIPANGLVEERLGDEAERVAAIERWFRIRLDLKERNAIRGSATELLSK